MYFNYQYVVCMNISTIKLIEKICEACKQLKAWGFYKIQKDFVNNGTSLKLGPAFELQEFCF